MAKSNKARLEAWLREVLRHNKGVLELEDGQEATVCLEDGCVVAYTYDEAAAPGEAVYHARIRLVSENPTED